MMRRRTSVCVMMTVALLLIPAAARAQPTMGPFRGLATAHIGTSLGNDDAGEALSVGASVAVLEETGWGAEFDFGYADSGDEPGEGLEAQSYMLNAIIVRPKGRLRPFGVAGAGVIHARTCVDGVPGGHDLDRLRLQRRRRRAVPLQRCLRFARRRALLRGAGGSSRSRAPESQLLAYRLRRDLRVARRALRVAAAVGLGGRGANGRLAGRRAVRSVLRHPLRDAAALAGRARDGATSGHQPGDGRARVVRWRRRVVPRRVRDDHHGARGSVALRSRERRDSRRGARPRQRRRAARAPAGGRQRGWIGAGVRRRSHRELAIGCGARRSSRQTAAVPRRATRSSICRRTARHCNSRWTPPVAARSSPSLAESACAASGSGGESRQEECHGTSNAVLPRPRPEPGAQPGRSAVARSVLLATRSLLQHRHRGRDPDRRHLPPDRCGRSMRHRHPGHGGRPWVSQSGRHYRPRAADRHVTRRRARPPERLVAPKRLERWLARQRRQLRRDAAAACAPDRRQGEARAGLRRGDWCNQRAAPIGDSTCW